MSEWLERTSNVVALRPKLQTKINARRVIVPHVSMSANMDGFNDHLRLLLANNGQARQGIDHLLPKGAGDIERVTVVERADGSPAFMELRVEMPHGAKSYRVIYRGDVTGSDDAREDGCRLLAGFVELSNAGLYTPTNARALLDAQHAARGGHASRLAIIWCEGEKTREAVEKRLSADHAAEGFEALRLNPVTSATLGGASGVKHANYRLRPYEEATSKYIVVGKNDEALDLAQHVHFVVLDNDQAGRAEGIALANKLNKVYGVSINDIFIVEPPSDAPSGWDDADRLPPTCDEAQRIDMFLSAARYSGWWRTKPVKGGKEEIIDVTSIANRRRALRLAGVNEAFTDAATGREHVVGPWAWGNGYAPGDAELVRLAEAAVTQMGFDFCTSHLANWAEPLQTLVSDTTRDLIHEETMSLIDIGRPQITEDNNPRNLFLKLFDLENTPYTQEAGWHLIRDIVATRLRPAFRAQPISPQLLYVFYGGEGAGKSTAVKVLAGGSPDPVRDTDRYTDTLDFHDLSGTDSHANLTLYQKIVGKTAVEFADKSLGTSIRSTRADLLKHFTNKGEVEYRHMNAKNMSKCNLRCVRIFTTNSPDILTEDMGSRRWIIINVSKTRRLTAEQMQARLAAEQREPTFEENQILQGLNPGLDWLHANFPAMLAQMYDSGAWRGALHPNPAMLKLMKGTQGDYLSQQNWEIQLEAQLAEYNSVAALGLRPASLADWARDMRSSPAPQPREWGRMLRKMGWTTGLEWADGKTVRVWFNTSVTDSPKAIKKYLVWLGASQANNGHWHVQDEPTADAVAVMAAQMGANPDVPF